MCFGALCEVNSVCKTAEKDHISDKAVLVDHTREGKGISISVAMKAYYLALCV